MKCKQCLTPYINIQKFCNNCGTQLEKTCKSCAAEISESAKFCGECGAAQDWESNDKRVSDENLTTPRSQLHSKYSGDNNYFDEPEDIDIDESPNLIETYNIPFSDWWNKDFWVSGSIEFQRGMDGVFKKAPRQINSHLSISDSLTMLREFNSVEASLNIELCDSSNEVTIVSIVIDVRKDFCVSFQSSKGVLFVNSINDLEVFEFLDGLNHKGIVATYLELPRSIWDEG